MHVKVGIVTVSDRSAKGEQEDASGELLKRLCPKWDIVAYRIIPDEQDQIEETLKTLADKTGCHLILTTGGTGFAPRDVTPEATKSVIDKEAPGLCEAMRAATLKFTKYAILSRAVAGIRNQTLIINLPGSPKGVEQCFAVIEDILPHALALISEDPQH
ncbi:MULTISPECIES: molybdopterin adenylyltransferase [unclassified Thermoactinomyces]|jgi:molybdopterin adenylyltransferase|uniref:molybdopterin adenylyltransferase n=1 Tax=unclassified Thermoactinomyces TaxID=2634588 RepID=UPI0018DCF5C9|nr:MULTISPECIES: molybdopterin adenylyltransferase [unclassified Thermoactinomyces]MBH8599619.1 molybdopterin adenylyltransferase [Thermoactinomyces sp. CICC 10523]MBH8605733.1 molybdopterin adenylyltransferase [Thermoactinomyces sp. CICC 10522]